MERDARPPLLYCPSAEPAVLFLLGLLWEHVPERFAFGEFEVSRGSNIPDASGLWLDNGVWREVTFEFKLYSSDVLRQRRPMHVDWLICWEHDGGEAVSQYADHVLELRRVWGTLRSERRGALIGNVREHPKARGNADYRQMLTGLDTHERELVERICSSWACPGPC